MPIRHYILLPSLGLAFSLPLLAAEPDEAARLEMDELVVTGTAAPAPIWGLPRSVSVITREDIEQAPGNSVVDLLAREANVNLRSFWGNDKFSGIDIRGMGDTFTSNVIVMIDGVRQNSPDLSGADLSGIPLSQIERIEIIRGASGVRYGDGAVGGVINIITQRGEHTGTLAYASYGAYHNRDLRLRGDLAQGDYRISANASDFHTDGHRRNSFLDKQDASLRLDYAPSGPASLFLDARLHTDAYGLPGPVSKAAFTTAAGRRGSNAPHDRGSTLERRYSAGVDLDGGSLGQTHLQLSLRARSNPFLIGFTPARAVFEQQSRITTHSRELDLSHRLGLALFGRPLELELGYNRRRASYAREENGRTSPGQSQQKNGRIDDQGLYVSGQWRLGHGLVLDLGYRWDSYQLRRASRGLNTQCDTVFVIIPPLPIPVPVLTNCRDVWVQGAMRTDTWHNTALDAGLSWSLHRNLILYLNHSRSFRNPNLDEVVLSSPDLHPQDGTHWDLGLRYRRGGWLEGSLGLFHFSDRDEIFFDGVVNRNYDQATRRQGAELEMRLYPEGGLMLWGNLAYTDARFSGNHARIPLVPYLKTSAGLVWQAGAGMDLSLSANHVGTRIDGLDLDNTRFDKLPAYTVVDTRIRYRHGDLSLFAGINNLFDTVYSTVSFGETFYPMPGRNAYAGLSMKF